MMFRPHQAVETDISEAFAYYHERSPVVAEGFLNEFDAALALLRTNPLIGAFIHAPARRVRLRRFPYLLVYLPTDTEIFLVALIHSKRDAASWRSRLG